MSRASYVTVDEITLQNTADAIRTKTGKSAAMYPSQFATEIGKIPQGQEYAPADAVRFVDYDGTLLYSYSAAEFLALSVMPTQPTHAGLTSQGWTYSLAGAQSYVEEWGFLDIGALYDVTSGNTEIEVEIIAPQLSIYLTLCPKGTFDIDWGDGSTHDTVTGTSITTAKHTQHSYSTGGNYTIILTASSSSNTVSLGYNNYPVINNQNTSSNYYRSYSSCVVGLKLSSNISNVYGYYMTNLEYIIFSTTKSITLNNFSAAYSLKTLIYPAIQSSSGMHQYMYNLKYVCIPENSVMTYFSANLSDAPSLRRLIIPSNGSHFTTNITLRSNCHFLEILIVPSQSMKVIVPSSELDLTGKTQILDYNFTNALATTITIPNTITSWSSNYPFMYCNRVDSITVNSTIIDTLGYMAALKSVTLNNTYSANPANFVSQCYALQSINLSKFSNYPNGSLCASCTSLKTVTFNTTATTLGNYAFQYCYNLKTITLPSSLISIGNNAFYQDSNLITITIPSTVTSIGTQAFYNCYGLMEIHLKPTTPPTITNTNVFYNVPSTCVFYVPTASLNTYKTTNYWSTWASQMVGE